VGIKLSESFDYDNFHILFTKNISTKIGFYLSTFVEKIIDNSKKNSYNVYIRLCFYVYNTDIEK